MELYGPEEYGKSGCDTHMILVRKIISLLVWSGVWFTDDEKNIDRND